MFCPVLYATITCCILPVHWYLVPVCTSLIVESSLLFFLDVEVSFIVLVFLDIFFLYGSEYINVCVCFMVTETIDQICFISLFVDF